MCSQRYSMHGPCLRRCPRCTPVAEGLRPQPQTCTNATRLSSAHGECPRSAAVQERGHAQKQSAEESEKTRYKHWGPLQVREIAASTPCAPATASHWVTEADTSFMGTVCADAPLPGPSVKRPNHCEAQLSACAAQRIRKGCSHPRTLRPARPLPAAPGRCAHFTSYA